MTNGDGIKGFGRQQKVRLRGLTLGGGGVCNKRMCYFLHQEQHGPLLKCCLCTTKMKSSIFCLVFFVISVSCWTYLLNVLQIQNQEQRKRLETIWKQLFTTLAKDLVWDKHTVVDPNHPKHTAYSVIYSEEGQYRVQRVLFQNKKI